MPQFNGKQGGALRHGVRPVPALPPQRSADEPYLGSLFIDKPLSALNKRLGRRCRAFRQPGYRPTRWLRVSFCETWAVMPRCRRGGRPWRSLCLPHMTNTRPFNVRLSALSVHARVAVLPLALAAAFPAVSQTLLAQAATEPQLRETVITATRVARPLADSVSDVSVIDRETIEASAR